MVPQSASDQAETLRISENHLYPPFPIRTGNYGLSWYIMGVNGFYVKKQGYHININGSLP
jgi:hypothetical protein